MITYRSAGLRPLLRPIVWRSPWLYWPVALLRQRRNIFSRKFDILIDGYQRSANTFAVRAFELCQPFSIVVSSHNHNPAAIIAAIRMGKPVLVLIRHPEDAIASWTVHSRYPLNYTIASYIDFYKRLLPYVDQVCTALFEEIAGDFPSVVERLNARYKTSFQSLMIDKTTTEKIFERIENDFGITYNGRPFDELKVSRPSAERRKFKDWVVKEMERAQYSAGMKGAREIFTQFSASAFRNGRHADSNLKGSSSLAEGFPQPMNFQPRGEGRVI